MNLFEKLLPLEAINSSIVERKVVSMKVNGHFHTPYSFSAFSEMKQAFDMAVDENIDVLGINDFYTMDGYEEFASLCMKYKKFPLFNIEFMGLQKEEQAAGIRVNDPSNPGRTYFSGKGLDFPVSLKGNSLEKLNSVRSESDKQTREMVQKASDHLVSIDPDLALDYDDILKNHTMGMVRERHIAKVIRIKVFEKCQGEDERRDMLKRIFGGKECSSDLYNAAALEGEIRSQLLKSGGVAFVKEDPKAFLDLKEVINIIIEAGGIPCYPVLLDDKNGNYTEYEEDMNVLYEKLTALNVYSLELIPGRNKIAHFKPFVEFFDKKGFVISFGTEHNTPQLDPLTVSVGDSELDEYLMMVGYEGACVIAAHQYFRARGEEGYVKSDGSVNDRDEFVKMGDVIINDFIK